MAVAVKTSSGARSGGASGSLALVSLLGVVYLVACLAVVFKLLPTLWWPAWVSIAGQDVNGVRYLFVGGSLLLLLGLGIGVGLLWVGGRLLGSKPPPGARAGVFVGFAGLLAVLGLTRWASTYFESLVFESRSLDPFWGAILTGVAGGLLLALWLRIFTFAWMQRALVGLESMGWFHATSYKASQGRIVRRATIVGLLLLAGTGIWSLASGGSLRRGSSDWVLHIPFTGSVAIDSIGDARTFIAPLFDEKMPKVQVKWIGESSLPLDQVVSFDAYRDAVLAVVNDEKMKVPENVKEYLTEAAKGNPVKFLQAVNHAIVEDGVRTKLLEGTTFHADIRRRLVEVDKLTSWTDITGLLAAVKKEGESAKKTEAVGWVTKIPTAIVLVDRFDLQQANEKVKPEANVEMGLRANPNFLRGKYNEGDIVPTSVFNEEEKRIYAEVARDYLRGEDGKKALEELDEKSKSGDDFLNLLRAMITATGNPDLRKDLESLRTNGLGRDEEMKKLPTAVPLAERITLSPASGTMQYADVTLLPSVRFTLPILLLVLSVWMAWRAVNVPNFADFLIATEAEMNKVSWTTNKRLAQDTVVVLVTVFLMAVFLFGMDYFWKTVLSLKWPVNIGVLHIPEDGKNTRESLEQKKW